MNYKHSEIKSIITSFFFYIIHPYTTKGRTDGRTDGGMAVADEGPKSTMLMNVPRLGKEWLLWMLLIILVLIRDGMVNEVRGASTASSI